MDIDLDDVDLPTTKEKEMKDDSTEIFDKYEQKFLAVLEEDSDHNSEVWSAFSGFRSSLPKKGDLVVYFPQGHLEHEKPHLRLLRLPRQPPKEEVRTYDLQPQIICRVERVQLMLKQIKEADADYDIYAKITLHPEPEVNSEEKELEQSDEIKDCIYNEDGSSATISTPSLFSKILNFYDEITIRLWIPPKAAIEFFCLDNESMDLQNEVTARDFHGNEWKFPLFRDNKYGEWLLGWSEFARARKLQLYDRVIFLREKDKKLRFGIRRHFDFPLGIGMVDPLSQTAGAILKKSIFSVMYGSRANYADFVIPYQKYMKSITRPEFIGAKVHLKQYNYSSTRDTGVVTGLADLDPKNWPNSKWKCLLVKWNRGYRIETRVSPWEIVFDDSLPKHKRPRTTLQDLSPFMSYRGFDDSLPKHKRPQTTLQYFSPLTSYLDKHNCLLSKEVTKLENVQEPGSIHFQGDTTNHPFDIEKQTPAPQTSSQFTPFPDGCSSTSFLESKSTTNYKELNISNCSVDDLSLHLKGNHSYENLEFDSCSFSSSARLPIPITVKKLKITNCVDTEQVFTVLMDPNLSVESLEIDSCSSFSSMSTGGIPATLRQLKIVNCMNLKSLSKSFKTKKSSSIGEHVHYSTAGTLQLRKLEIQNCVELEFLPKGLHKLRNLDILSINNCSSIEYFPEGGLPRTCLTSLSISECENLKCLPNKLHKVTSLQKLSISGCPSLMFFPEGGLPSNLVSLHIIDCENLISLSQWELHKLKHLRKYSFSCGY